MTAAASCGLIDRATGRATLFLDVANARGAAFFGIGSRQIGLRSFAFHPNLRLPGQPGYRRLYTISTEDHRNQLVVVSVSCVKRGDAAMWTDSARAKYARPAKRYATDLTDAEFALVEPRLPPPCRLGRRRTTDLRAVLDAIFYLLRTGCQWRLLPKGFPPKSTVFGYFRRWWQDGTLLGLYYALLVLARAGGRPRGAADRGHRRQPVGQDHGERRPARLRCRQEDQRPQAARAGRHAGPAAARHRPSRQRPGPRRARPAAHAASAAASPGFACCSPTAAIRARSRPRPPATERLELAIVKRSDHAAGFVVLPRRWIVERSFAWFGRNRRLAKDVETLIASSTAMLYLAATRLLKASRPKGIRIFGKSYQATCDNVVAEWQLDARTLSKVDLGSRREVLRIAQPRVDHCADQLMFNPTAAPGSSDFGTLYIGAGDGGNSANNTDPQQPGSGPEQRSRQDPAHRPVPQPDGSALRHPGRQPVRRPEPAALPRSGRSACATRRTSASTAPARGTDPDHRHRPAPDRGGQSRPARRQLWLAVARGHLRHRPAATTTILYALPADDASRGFTYPVAQYDHGEGNRRTSAITGGFVYRGTAIPALLGHYLFGDMVTGRVFHVPVADAPARPRRRRCSELTLSRAARRSR